MQNLNVYDLTLAEVRELIKDPNANWRKDAVCIGMNTNEWIFPADAKGLNAKQMYGKALPICRQCPVRPQCLAFAIEYRCDSGVWGGLIPDQRKGLKYFSTMREIFKKRDSK